MQVVELVDVAELDPDAVRVLVELILRVEADVRDLVGAEVGYASGIHFRIHAEGAKLERVRTPARLECEAPIRCDAVEAAGTRRGHAERALGADREGPVARDLGIDHVVPPEIAAEPQDLLAEAAFDHGGGAGEGCEPRAEEWEPPGRRRVPDVLDRGVVVEREPIGEVLAEELGLPRQADVEVVPGELPGDAVIGALDEGAQALLLPDRAAVE